MKENRNVCRSGETHREVDGPALARARTTDRGVDILGYVTTKK
jgi:hypothetical protein